VKILVLEDHPDLRAMVAGHLMERGFKVDALATLEEARAALLTVTYDLAVLDLGLPDGDGRELLGELQTPTTRAMPKIVMTARDSLAERLACLNGGADDYLAKPFHLQELDARLNAVLRRPRARRSCLTCGALTYDPLSKEASVRGVPFDVNRRELQLLELLLRAIGRSVTRAFLGREIYRFDETPGENALEAIVSRLRARLRSIDAGVQIETVRGIGYRLMPEAGEHS
jgi:two-component system OmpR family response regulator